MRTLACLAALVLAGGPAAAAPILIDDIATTELLPIDQLVTDARWAAIAADGAGLDRAILGPVERFVLALRQTPSGGLDAGVLQAMANLTGDLRPAQDDLAVNPREPSETTARRGGREVQRAAVSNVQPAALTLAGVCLALAFAGGREWHRRSWYRRYMRRRR